MHHPKRLRFKNVSGAGLQIHADIDFNPKCVEFALKRGYQNIAHGKPGDDMLIAFEPWIQFAPKDWDDMIAKVFEEMVDLWNEKYAEAGAASSTDADQEGE